MKYNKQSVIGWLASGLLLFSLVFFTGCTTPGQTQAMIQVGSGQGVGTNLLKKNSVNGVVNAAYLATYEAEIPNIAGIMQGKVTPADLHNILNVEGATSGLSADKLSVVGLLQGATTEWITYNQGTNEGALVDVAAKNFAKGLGQAVGLVTGVNYTPPPTSSVLRLKDPEMVASDMLPVYRFNR